MRIDGDAVQQPKAKVGLPRLAEVDGPATRDTFEMTARPPALPPAASYSAMYRREVPICAV